MTNIGTLIIPPIIALIIYLSYTYILKPLYAHRQRYAQYLPIVPTPSIFTRIRSSISNIFTTTISQPFSESLARLRGDPRPSTDDEDMFGDEELEENVPTPYGVGTRDWETNGRRLSRELESGFRDDSSDDEESGRGRARGGRR